MAITLKTVVIATGVHGWLEARGCTCSMIKLEEEIRIHYTLSLDTKPQPAVVIRDESVIFPKGSQEDVIMAFLAGM